MLCLEHSPAERRVASDHETEEEESESSKYAIATA